MHDYPKKVYFLTVFDELVELRGFWPLLYDQGFLLGGQSGDLINLETRNPILLVLGRLVNPFSFQPIQYDNTRV